MGKQETLETIWEVPLRCSGKVVATIVGGEVVFGPAES